MLYFLSVAIPGFGQEADTTGRSRARRGWMGEAPPPGGPVKIGHALQLPWRRIHGEAPGTAGQRTPPDL